MDYGYYNGYMQDKALLETLAMNNCLLQCLCKALNSNNCTLNDINCKLDQSLCNQRDIITIISNIQMSLATRFSTAVQAEYPEVTGQGIIYHYNGVLREIVGNIVVIFRGTLNQALPVYLSDNTGYAHIVNAPGSDEQLLGNEVVVNTIIPAIYEGNYIKLQ